MIFKHSQNFTYLFKEVFPSLQSFIELMTKSEQSTLFTVSEEFATRLYYLLLTRHANSWIAYDMMDTFKQELLVKTYNLEKKYGIIFQALEEVYSETTQKLFDDYVDNLTTTNNSRQAITPTYIEPSSEFATEYTNIQLLTTNTSTQNRRGNLIDALDRINRLSDRHQEELINEYSDMFIQIYDDEESNYFQFCNERGLIENE